MSALLIGLCLSLAQSPLDRPVTFSAPAMPAQRLFAELSEQTGIPLFASERLREQPFLLHVENRPLREAMDRIADAAAAEWVHEPDGYVLRRSAKQQAELEQAEFQESVQSLNEYIEAFFHLSAFQTFDEEAARRLVQEGVETERRFFAKNQGESRELWQRATALQNRSPLGRLMVRLILSIGAETIVKIPAGHRVVWTSAPTRMQRAFPDEGAKALSDFRAENLVHAELAQRERLEGGRLGDMSMITRPPLNEEVERVRLTISSAEPAWYRVSVFLENKELQVVGEHTIVLYARPVEELNQRAFFADPEVMAAVGRGGRPLPLTEKSQLIRRFHQDRTAAPIVSQELLQQMLHPERFEPLGDQLSVALLEWAKHEKKALAAWLTDPMDVTFRFLRMGEPNLDAYLLALKSRETSHFTRLEQENWMTLHPKRRVIAEETYVRRAPVGAYVRAGYGNDKISAEAAAEFAYQTLYGHESDAFLTLFLLTRQADLISAEPFEHYANHGQRLYGALTVPQRQALLAGKEIPVSHLTPEQQRFASLALYSQDYLLRYSKEYERLDPDRPMMDLLEKRMDPTDAFSNGIPRELALRTVEVKAPTIKTAEGSAPATFNWDLFLDRLQSPGTLADLEKSEQKFFAGTIRELRLQLKHGDAVVLDQHLPESPVFDRQPVRFRELPADLRALIRQWMDRLRSAPAGIGG